MKKTNFSEWQDCPKTKNEIEQSTIYGVGGKAKMPDDVETEMENRVLGRSVGEMDRTETNDIVDFYYLDKTKGKGLSQNKNAIATCTRK